MARKYMLFFCFMLFVFNGIARQNCNCLGNFTFMVDKIKKNYVGFADKVTAANTTAFDRFTDSCKNAAARATPQTCLGILRRWLTFFKDYHVSVSVNGDSSNYNTIREMFAGTEKLSMSEKDFQVYLGQNRNKIDPIEGIWEEAYHSYRIGIIRDRKRPGNEFIGFILRADSVYWMPGQVKLRIRKNANHYQTLYFLNRDHTEFRPSLTVNKSSFEAGFFGTWHKVFPKKDSMAIPVNVEEGPYFRALGSRTSLITIPSFHLEYKDEIDSLITKNEHIIKNSDHFIIDLRNNGGGSVLAFEKLIPFIYTQPIITKGASVLATADNIRDCYDVTDYPNISDSMKAVFKKDADELRAHEGQLYNLWPDDTLRLNAVLPLPRRVSIIVNENAASSTELFLLKAMQSKKVKVYGKHTMGAVDYSDAATTNMPCNLYVLRYSTSRTNRLPQQVIDYIGIQPNVIIPDTVTNWVEFVQSQK